jgi:dTDP-4-amino-4,6-dideoxygalactose transaminase
VEDAAQAVLAEYRGKRVGSFGNIGCFSLHPLKTLNACGDGGVLTTNDPKLYEHAKLLRNLGLQTRENCVEWSSNSRLDTIQAAMLMVKLKYVEAWTEGRRKNAAFYQKSLKGVKGLALPMDREFEKGVYHTFIVQAERRDELKKFLADSGIETAIHYPLPIHLQKAAASLGWHKGSFPVAERQATKILSLPVYPELEASDLSYVADRIKEFYQ